MRVVMLDEPRPGVDILVDGRVATVRDVRVADGTLTIEFEYADGARGDVVLRPDDAAETEDAWF